MTVETNFVVASEMIKSFAEAQPQLFFSVENEDKIEIEKFKKINNDILEKLNSKVSSKKINLGFNFKDSVNGQINGDKIKINVTLKKGCNLIPIGAIKTTGITAFIGSCSNEKVFVNSELFAKGPSFLIANVFSAKDFEELKEIEFQIFTFQTIALKSYKNDDGILTQTKKDTKILDFENDPTFKIQNTFVFAVPKRRQFVPISTVRTTIHPEYLWHGNVNGSTCNFVLVKNVNSVEIQPISNLLVFKNERRGNLTGYHAVNSLFYDEIKKTYKTTKNAMFKLTSLNREIEKIKDVSDKEKFLIKDLVSRGLFDPRKKTKATQDLEKLMKLVKSTPLEKIKDYLSNVKICYNENVKKNFNDIVPENKIVPFEEYSKLIGEFESKFETLEFPFDKSLYTKILHGFSRSERKIDVDEKKVEVGENKVADEKKIDDDENKVADEKVNEIRKRKIDDDEPEEPSSKKSKQNN